jgi:DNA-binding HxlR family transcriptional regulator
MKKKEGTQKVSSNKVVTIDAKSTSADEKKFKEIFNLARETKNQFCPVRDVIDRISDKWSVLSILALGANGTMRFNEMRKSIGDVSQRMLTVTLKNLEKDGFIRRKVYAEVPPRVEYTLTPLGIGLLEQVDQLSKWAVSNADAILKSRKAS